MAVKYPDILQHNNSNYALVDSSQLRGTAYLLGTLVETGSIPSDKRNPGMIVFLTGSGQFYGFYATSSLGWNTGSYWQQLGTGATGAGFPYSGSAVITGSLLVSGSITGSISGSVYGYVSNSQTSSFILNSQTSSFVINNQTGSFAITGSNRFFGTETITGSIILTGSYTQNGSMIIGSGSNSEYKIEIGGGRTGNGYAYVDFVGDTTYTDYGLRIIRGNSGANSDSSIIHRGTGNLIINANEGGAIKLSGLTNATQTNVVGIDGSGRLYIQPASSGSGGSVGPGTTNYLPKFTSTTTIGNSSISEDSLGAEITINASAIVTGPLSVNDNINHLLCTYINKSFVVIGDNIIGVISVDPTKTASIIIDYSIIMYIDSSTTKLSIKTGTYTVTVPHNADYQDFITTERTTSSYSIKTDTNYDPECYFFSTEYDSLADSVIVSLVNNGTNPIYMNAEIRTLGYELKSG